MKLRLPTLLLALAPLALAVSTACTSEEQTADPIADCGELCALVVTATPLEGECINDFMTASGYPIRTEPLCIGFTSASGCNLCYSIILPTRDECIAAWQVCF
jgi:hypothetical protein